MSQKLYNFSTRSQKANGNFTSNGSIPQKRKKPKLIAWRKRLTDWRAALSYTTKKLSPQGLFKKKLKLYIKRKHLTLTYSLTKPFYEISLLPDARPGLLLHTSSEIYHQRIR